MIDYPPPGAMAPKRRRRAMKHLGVSAAAGAVVGTIAAFTQPWQSIPLLTWDAAALTWMAAVWWGIAGLDALETSAHATSEDPGRASADLGMLLASVASLVAVVLGIVKAGHAAGGEKFVLLCAGVLTIVISWAVVHTLFTLRYAALYYAGPDGGIEFNEDEKPNYHDFAYLAFTIGMTYQVSDTNLQTKEIRYTALRHALLSYLFGTVIIAATINLAAGLVK